jgi:potassium efflux system protein
LLSLVEVLKLGESSTIYKFILAVITASGILFAWPGQAVPQKTPPQEARPTATSTPAAEQAIELPEIVARAEELNLLLREMNERLEPDPIFDSIDQSLRSQDGLIRVRRPEVEKLIADNPTLVEIQGLEQDWQAHYNQSAGWSRMLTEQVKAVEEDVRTLDGQQAQWEATLSQSRKGDPIMAVIDLARNSLSEIKTTRSKALEKLTLLVTLQNRVSQQSQVITGVLEDIREAKAHLQRSLFKRDDLPLWKAHSQQQSDQYLQISFRRMLDSALARTREFLRMRRRAVMGIFAFFLAVLAIILAMRRRILRRAHDHPELRTTAYLFQHPVSLALLAALIVALPLSSNAPTLIRNMVAVLFVVPVLRFIPLIVHPPFRPLLYLLIFFGLASGILEMLVIPQTLKREISAGLSLAGIALGAWLIRPSRISQIQPPVKKPSTIIIGARATLALILCSLLANLTGYVALSRVLRSGAIHSAFFAVVLPTAYIATIAFLSLFWQTRQVASLSSIRTYGAGIAKWGSRILSVIAIALWFYTTLEFFTIREDVLNALSSVLTKPIKLGAINFSLGDVLTFLLLLALGVIFANIIRVILGVDVLVRLPLKQGLSYAISTITYYLLLLTVFLLALAASGVELSRFTLLTGAFGVGAGFGLQNIISNFFSGIILLFERPIRIGDSLEIDGVAGDVERIGMRSTSIRTSQGAEVIVPNSILISNKVINWTLNQQRRRDDLLVVVPYNTDPERVLKLLVEVAAAHRDVLRDPEPTALFLGFGNNALNFELRFWVADARTHHLVKSDLGVKVAAALRNSGIEFALPRQEMSIRNIKEATPGKEERLRNRRK